MGAASKNAAVRSKDSSAPEGVSVLDQGFQTILEKPALGFRAEPQALLENVFQGYSAQKNTLRATTATSFKVKLLVAQDILLLLVVLLVMIGHPGPFRWIQVLACSTLVILGAGSSIVAACLAQESSNLQDVQDPTVEPSKSFPQSRMDSPVLGPKPR